MHGGEERHWVLILGGLHRDGGRCKETLGGFGRESGAFAWIGKGSAFCAARELRRAGPPSHN